MSFVKYFFLFFGMIQTSLTMAQNTINGAQMEGQILPKNFEAVNIIGIYPNPATDYIMVEIKQSELQNAHFVLKSMIGNEIEITPEALGEDKFRIGLVGYPAGFYFLVIIDDTSQFKKAFRFLIK
jgi:hypothetical protein